MVAKTSPVTPAVVRWAVEQDGRALPAIAAAAGVEPETLSAWMEGTEQPRKGDVTKLAARLRRPRAFFFLPAPPEQSALPSGFRHPPGAGSREVSQSVLLEARRSRRIQRAVATALSGTEVLDVPSATTEERPEDVARRVRSWLQVPNDRRWADPPEALRDWRRALDQVGVLVFFLQLGADEVRGFAAWDDRAPLIVVNISSEIVPARIFTLGHELAHLVLREATACLDPTGGRLTIDSSTERWCERFAAALIMPRGEVAALMESRGVGGKQAGINEVTAMSSRFRASARATAVRLEDLGYAEDGLYGHVLAVFKPRARSGGRPQSPPRHTARIRQYGEHTIETLLTGLPPRDAMAVLRIDADDARRLADEVPGVVAI